MWYIGLSKCIFDTKEINESVYGTHIHSDASIAFGKWNYYNSADNIVAHMQGHVSTVHCLSQSVHFCNFNNVSFTKWDTRFWIL